LVKMVTMMNMLKSVRKSRKEREQRVSWAKAPHFAHPLPPPSPVSHSGRI
jgi:hypothetical protein